MSIHLRECLDITPNGVIRPGSLQDYRVLRAQPWWPALRATSSHLRLWADWPTLQPDAGVAIDDPASRGRPNLLAFDEQIRLAAADGLRVILMPYRYPRWANGTAGIDPASDENLLFEPENRVRSQLFLDWWTRRGTPEAAAPREALRRGMKALEYRLPPAGHAPGSPWADYVEFLLRRWGRAIDYLEVVNEPNLQLWPQRSPSHRPEDPEGRFDVTGSRLTVHVAIAQMMATADALVRRSGRDVRLLGPSHSDADSPRPRQVTVHTTTPYSEVQEPFVESLLDELERIGFRGNARWTWAFHDYNDMELDQLRVRSLRARLEGRWRGTRRDGGPELYCTEGGVRLSRIRARFGATLPYDEVLRRQAEVLRAAVLRHHTAAGAGSGVGLMTQYTVTADPNYDCALREVGGEARPAFDAWAAIPEGRLPRPVLGPA